jgi:uridine kinase
MRHFLIGIAGGSGSGKTTVARAIMDAIGHDRFSYIDHDSYYKDRSNLTPKEREAVNYDHPDALDTDLLVQHLERLRSGLSAEIPIYDYMTHTRKKETQLVKPRKTILVEGILIFVDPRLRNLFDMKVFVDTDPDLCFIRRLKRDITERNRTTESIIEQYLRTVRPMHLEFVEPTKRYADIIVPEGGFNRVAIDILVTTIQSKLE